jgi:hypothetical protein
MNRAQGRSRRGISAPHDSDRSRIRRCPICQWAADQDHAEALAIDAARTRGKPLSQAPPPSPQLEDDELAYAGFALV